MFDLMIRKILISFLMVIVFAGTVYATDSTTVRMPYILRFSCGFKAEANVMSLIHWGEAFSSIIVLADCFLCKLMHFCITRILAL